jgi:hypothetical protein
MTLILSGTDGLSDVDGSAATPAVRGADANTGIFFPAADTIAFAEGGVEVARITNTAAWSFGSSGTATGTSGQALVSAGSGAAPAWGTPASATTATTATNLAGGSNGTIPYQSALGTTQMLAAGTSGLFLQSSGAGAPVWAAAGASINYVARSTTYTAVAADKGFLFGCTSTWTLSLTAATTLGNGWFLYLQNLGTGVITVDPNASETIGGAATADLNPGDIWLIVCDGTNFQLNRLVGNNRQIFTSSGTFTVPAGVYTIYAEAWGGGGSGAKANTGCGGGAGGYSAGLFNVTPGQTITATIGSGGAAVSASTANGNSGGNTTFSSLTANGGNGGNAIVSQNWEAFATGGTASGGTINNRGGSGYGLNVLGSVAFTQGGSAGNGGTGGARMNQSGGTVISFGPQDASIPGGGGFGASSTSTSGAGARGEVRVYWV